MADGSAWRRRAAATAHTLSLPIAWSLGALFLVVALLAMLRAPRVPYADGWRFVAHFLRAPFPRDILAPDNGHHEILPNAVRVLELHWLGGHQGLQIATGIALLLATLAVWWRVARRLDDARARAAAMLAAALGLCWLGNIRALGHANESVHAYLVTLCLAGALAALLRSRAGAPSIAKGLKDPPDAIATVIAVACAGVAAFSFGSGIACFVALAAVLALRRAAWTAWLVLGIGVTLTVLLRMAAGASPTTSAVPASFAPLAQGAQLMRWLAAPFVYAAWPVLDPAIAAQLPMGPLRSVAIAIARGVESATGPVMLARWPTLLVGAAGMGALLAGSVRTWRRPQLLACAGIAIAWFAVAVGALVAIVRARYFDVFPEQLLAPRYVVWSSLFWAGLGVAAIAHATRPRRALGGVVLVAIALLPSELWMARLGARMTDVAETTALAATVGVVTPDLPLGETAPADLATAVSAMRAAGVGPFAWPETRWLGHAVPSTQLQAVSARALQVDAVDNTLGAPGRRVRFDARDVDAERLLLVDPDGVARGLARRGRDGRWIGWMHGRVATERDAGDRLRVATLR